MTSTRPRVSSLSVPARWASTLSMMAATAVGSGCQANTGKGYQPVEVVARPVAASWMDANLNAGTFVDLDGRVVVSACSEGVTTTTSDAPSSLIFEGTTLGSDGRLIHERWTGAGTQHTASTGQMLRARTPGDDHALAACCAVYGCGDAWVASSTGVTREETTVASAAHVRVKGGSASAVGAQLDAAVITRALGRGAAPAPVVVQARWNDAGQTGARTVRVQAMPNVVAVPPRATRVEDIATVLELPVPVDRPIVQIASVSPTLRFRVEGGHSGAARFYHGLPSLPRSMGRIAGWTVELQDVRQGQDVVLWVEDEGREPYRATIVVAEPRPWSLHTVTTRVGDRAAYPTGAGAQVGGLKIRTPFLEIPVPIASVAGATLYERCTDGEECGTAPDAFCVPVPGTNYCIQSDKIPLRPRTNPMVPCVAVPTTQFCVDHDAIGEALLALVGDNPMVSAVMRSLIEQLLGAGR